MPISSISYHSIRGVIHGKLLPAFWVLWEMRMRMESGSVHFRSSFCQWSCSLLLLPGPMKLLHKEFEKAFGEG